MTVDARALVTAAAVLGQRCPLALAVQLASPTDSLAALDQAVSASLLVEEAGGTEIALAHPRMERGLWRPQPTGRRGLPHARAAELTSGERGLAHRLAATAGPNNARAADLEAVAQQARTRAKVELAATLSARLLGCRAARPRENAASYWRSIH